MDIFNNEKWARAENNKNNRVAIPKDSFQEKLSSARKVIVIVNGGIATELGKQLILNDFKYF